MRAVYWLYWAVIALCCLWLLLACGYWVLHWCSWITTLGVGVYRHKLYGVDYIYLRLGVVALLKII